MASSMAAPYVSQAAFSQRTAHYQRPLVCSAVADRSERVLDLPHACLQPTTASPFNAVQTPKWVGLANYIELFTDDPNFWAAVYNTLFFAFVSIPWGLSSHLPWH